MSNLTKISSLRVKFTSAPRIYYTYSVILKYEEKTNYEMRTKLPNYKFISSKILISYIYIAVSKHRCIQIYKPLCFFDK